MPPHAFLNAQHRLRSGWWIALFLLVLAGLLLPLLLNARQDGGGVPIYQQALIVMTASVLCQGLRLQRFSELLGVFDRQWPRQWLVGAAGGAALMLLPALVLAAFGAVDWRLDGEWAARLGPTLALLAAAAVTEELLFRGFLFQRLIEGLGASFAQLLVAALFTLTHSEALPAHGAVRYLALMNIFLASILFGLAYLRTRSLAMPLGLHFAANALQGPILGFGVSGSDQPGLFVPRFHDAPEWVTGGMFGLEASGPGFACLLGLTALMWRWRRSTEA